MPSHLEIAARKLATALELHEFGVKMMRANLRRKHPDLDDMQIEELLARWLRTRPGAEHGDGPGQVVDWPRNR
jgi:hypothetical protein